MFKIKCNTVTSHEIEYTDASGKFATLELEYKPVEWITPLGHFGDDKITLVYAVHDCSPMNPAEESDDTFIDAYSDRNKEELYGVLGLDRYGDRNYDDIINHHEQEVEKRYVKSVLGTYNERELLEDFDAVDLDEVKLGLAKEVGSSHQTYPAVYERVLDQMWKDPAYFPGNLNAVLLDVYEHGGRVWSITGGGTRCRWDTSTGVGAWVPSASTLEYAEKGAKTRAHFRVRKQRTSYILERKAWNGAKDNWTAEPVETADSEHELLARAEELAEHLDCTEFQLFHGKRCRLEELAGYFLNEYNAYINGDMYGVVVQTYSLDGKPLTEDACWGYYTSEYTEEIMKEELATAINA